MTDPTALPIESQAPKDQQSAQRGRKLAVAVLLLLLGVGGGAVVRRLLYAPGRAGSGAAGTSAFQRTGLSAAAAAGWSRLLDVLSLPGARGFSFDRFATLLLGHDEPAAVAFFKDYENNPELMRIWKDFRDRRSESGVDAAWFAHQLSGSNEFSQLLNRHAERTDFVKFGEEVTRDLATAVLNSGATGVKRDKDIAADKFALAAPGSDQLSKTGASAETGAQGEAGSGSLKLGDLKKLQEIGTQKDVAKFETLFSKSTMDDKQKTKVLDQLLKGDAPAVACANANASAQCADALKKCQADPACAKHAGLADIGNGSAMTASKTSAADNGVQASAATPIAGIEDRKVVSIQQMSDTGGMQAMAANQGQGGGYGGGGKGGGGDGKNKGGHHH